MNMCFPTDFGELCQSHTCSTFECCWHTGAGTTNRKLWRQAHYWQLTFTDAVILQYAKEKKICTGKNSWNLGFHASFYTLLLEEEIKKLSYLSVLWLLFNLELFVTTKRRDCFQHHAKSRSFSRAPWTVPPQSPPGFSPAGRWGWRGNTTLSRV